VARAACAKQWLRRNLTGLWFAAGCFAQSNLGRTRADLRWQTPYLPGADSGADSGGRGATLDSHIPDAPLIPSIRQLPRPSRGRVQLRGGWKRPPSKVTGAVSLTAGGAESPPLASRGEGRGRFPSRAGRSRSSGSSSNRSLFGRLGTLGTLVTMADGRRVPIETLQPGDLIASLQIPGLVVSASSGSSDNTAVARGRSVWHFRSSMWRSIMWLSKTPQSARWHAEMQARDEARQGSMGRRLCRPYERPK